MPKNAFDMLMKRPIIATQSSKELIKNPEPAPKYPEPTLAPASKNYPKYRMMFDGGSRGNPGLCGAGAVIYKDNKEEFALSYRLTGKHTNNYAEYTALIIGLRKALEENITHLYVEGDSLLVINQCTGKYKVHTPSLFPLYHQSRDLIKKFIYISLHHVKRNKNKRADQLANQAMNLPPSSNLRPKNFRPLYLRISSSFVVVGNSSGP